MIKFKQSVYFYIHKSRLHWYEPWSGGTAMFENVGLAHNAFPDKKLLFTERWVESFDAGKNQFLANDERQHIILHFMIVLFYCLIKGLD